MRTGMKLRLGVAGVLVVAMLGLTGCGLFSLGGEEAPPEPTAPARTLVPTFTPTPVGEAPPTATAVAPPPTQVIVVEAAPAAVAVPVTDTAAADVQAAAAPATPTPAVTPGLKVEGEIVNVRLGPGTEFGLAGTVNAGEKFPIVGRNADKTWYLICCVNGQEVWVNSELTDESNEELAVEVTPAVAAAQPVAQAAPAQPAPAQPAAARPCRSDGHPGAARARAGGRRLCRDRRRRLQVQAARWAALCAQRRRRTQVPVGLHPQRHRRRSAPSQLLRLGREGWRRNCPSPTVSAAFWTNQQGTLGKYNYEYKVGLDQIPGNNVAGNYVIWVLDGNGERDSQTFSFTVPDGQGEVWMQVRSGIEATVTVTTVAMQRELLGEPPGTWRGCFPYRGSGRSSST